MEHIEIPYDWKEFVFHRCCSFNINSILEDSFQVEGKVRSEDKPSSSHLSTFSVIIQMKKHPVMSAQESALSQQFETWSRCRLLGKIVLSTRSRIAILADEIKCNNRTQSCADRLHLQSNFLIMEIEHYSKDSQPLDLLQRWHLGAIGNRSSSHSLIALHFVPGNWMLLGLRIGMSKAIRLRIQVQLVPGNWSGILFHMLTRSQNSKSIFEWKEDLKIPSWKTKNRWKKSTKKLEKLRIGSCTKSLRDDSKKKGDKIFSEESSRVIYEMGNLELKPRRLFSVLLAWNTHQRDWTCVYVAFGSDLIKTRWTRSQPDLKLWYRHTIVQNFMHEEESTDTINGEKSMRKPWTQNEEQRNVADGRTTRLSLTFRCIWGRRHNTLDPTVCTQNTLSHAFFSCAQSVR